MLTLLFIRKYALQQDARLKQFKSTNSTRRTDEKWNKNQKQNKTNLTLFYCWHLKQQAVKMISLKNNKPMLTRG